MGLLGGYDRHGLADDAATAHTSFAAALTAHARLAITAVVALKRIATLKRVAGVFSRRIIEATALGIGQGIAGFQSAGGEVLVGLAAVASSHVLPEAGLGFTGGVGEGGRCACHAQEKAGSGQGQLAVKRGKCHHKGTLKNGNFQISVV